MEYFLQCQHPQIAIKQKKPSCLQIRFDSRKRFDQSNFLDRGHDLLAFARGYYVAQDLFGRQQFFEGNLEGFEIKPEV